jgi:uncharacterized membrane protein YbjE (DUF340 family)
MLPIIFIFLAGIGLGYLFRNFSRLNSFTGKFSHILVFLLLFSLGLSVGQNEKIMQNIAAIGLHSLLITIFAIAGSLSIMLLYFKLRKK